MTHHQITNLLYFYGIFLITCGGVSVIFIGMKAKTALASGGTAGCLALLIAYLIAHETPGASIAGILLPAMLFIVFSWRSSKTLVRIFELIPKADAELNDKGIAFLVISLMAVVSFFVFALQLL